MTKRHLMIAKDRAPDSTLALLVGGYTFFSRRFARYGGDMFQTRLLLRRAICVRGREAAELFYDSSRFERHGAAPRRIRRTLLGTGGVQGLDDAAHQRRKAMLMSTVSPEGVRDLTERFAAEWESALSRWQRTDRVRLFDEAGRMLCRAVCGWVGVPLPEADVARRTNDLHTLVDSAAAVGPRHWRGRLAHRRAERWAVALIRQARTGALTLPERSPLRVLAEHRDDRGRLLPAHAAAVDLLNLLRPTVAVSRYVTFTAHALHRCPDLAARLREGDDDLVEPFVQEVRRYYPLFPLVPALTRRAFRWRDAWFPRGQWVLLDLYGTNHHPALWPEPNRFDPDRFTNWSGDPFGFLPQGGGDHMTGHRCVGERVTIELMKVGLTALTRFMEYEVPDQDLRVSLRRIPAAVASGFVLAGVRRRPTAGWLTAAGSPGAAGRVSYPSATSS